MCYTYSAPIGFDNRGSTIAITDMNGIVTDTFAYDTYGKCISRTGTSTVIFGYNGRDGVITDRNGLIYMRARYYSPEMRRFINADIVAGEIANGITLNRYAYANGNPAMFIDPLGMFGLLAGVLAVLTLGICLTLKGDTSGDNSPVNEGEYEEDASVSDEPKYDTSIKSVKQAREKYMIGEVSLEEIPPQYSPEPSIRAEYMAEQAEKKQKENPPKTESELEMMCILAKEKVAGQGWETAIDWAGTKMDRWAGYDGWGIPNQPRPSAYLKGASKAISTAQSVYSVGNIIYENYKAKEPWQETVSDIGIEVVGVGWSTAAMIIGGSVGTVFAPIIGTAGGIVAGAVLGCLIDSFYDYKMAPTFDNGYKFN